MRALATARLDGFVQTPFIHFFHAHVCPCQLGNNSLRQSKRGKTTRRGLALRTKITAASRHNSAPDRSLAPLTAFSFAAIRPMAPLIFSRLAFGVKKIRN